MTKKLAWPGLLLIFILLIISQILSVVTMLLVEKGGLRRIAHFSLTETEFIIQFLFLNIYYIISIWLITKALHFEIRLVSTLKNIRFNHFTWLFIFLTGISYQFIGSELDNLIAEVTGRNADSQKMIHTISSMKGTDGLIISIFFIAICPPLFEEIFFRHIIQKGLTVRYGFIPALIATSLLFAAIHMDLSVMFPIFMLSLVLGMLYEYYNLLASIILHFTVNLTVVLLVRMDFAIEGLNIENITESAHLDTRILVVMSVIFIVSIWVLFESNWLKKWSSS